MADTVPPLQTVWLVTAFTVGVGSTWMLAILFVVVEHPFAVAVTLILSVRGAVPELENVVFMLPLPPKEPPALAGTSLDQVYVVAPPAELLKLMAAVPPLQMFWLVGDAATTGYVFTEMFTGPKLCWQLFEFVISTVTEAPLASVVEL